MTLSGATTPVEGLRHGQSPSALRGGRRGRSRIALAILAIVVTSVGLRLDSFARVTAKQAPAAFVGDGVAADATEASTQSQRLLQHARPSTTVINDTLLLRYNGSEHTSNVAVFLPKPSARLTGPLCIFVPANAHDQVHLAELDAALQSWADCSVAIFTERLEVVEATEAVAVRKGIVRVLADLTRWSAWHEGTILSHPKLVRRGATHKTLAGRGQLSIPLYFWLSQLAAQQAGAEGTAAAMAQSCKWFMKCDTDTYVRRALLEERVLSGLNSDSRLYIGVPMSFNTRPYHTTSRYIHFQYNIGGPGYTFSRGLLRAVNMPECIESMKEDPVLLIHDDVATGYCSTQHVSGTSRLDITPTAAASSHDLLRYVASHFLNVTAVKHEPLCLDCVLSLHPCGPELLRELHHRDTVVGVANEAGASYCASKMQQCDLKLMQGSKAIVGHEWKPKEDLALMVKYWSVTRTAYLPTWERATAERIQLLIASLAVKDGAPMPSRNAVKDPLPLHRVE